MDSESMSRADSGMVSLSDFGSLETDDCSAFEKRPACEAPAVISKLPGLDNDRSRTEQRLFDKHPVQCTEDTEDAFEKLSLNDHDEGIDSMHSSIQEPVEIDLSERDAEGDTILHTAILCGKSELAVALIELADDVDVLNFSNSLHQTPLHLAVLTGQYDVLLSLLKRKVNVTARDHQGNTALHIACRLGDEDAVRVIVGSFEDNVNARKKYFAMKNCEGLTSLHVASQQKQFMIMGHLFMKGADVNIGDAKSGRTVLHYAVERKDIEMVSLLLTHTDIDVDCKTFKGETPLVMAYWRNYRDILKRLKSKGAYFSYDIVEDSDDEDYST